MENKVIRESFASLSTPLVADAVLRQSQPIRFAPVGLLPLQPGARLAGRVLPARHYGSVDVFLEAMASSEEGDVLVIDNDGRRDEGCIGDLTALEAQAHGLAGMIVWGLHRDTTPLQQIGLPIFSYGACPFGPRRIDPQESDALQNAKFGKFTTSRKDVVFADDDGAIFVSDEVVDESLAIAAHINNVEQQQASAVLSGETLYAQLKFEDYLSKRSKDPVYSFRDHLKEIGGAIEE